MSKVTITISGPVGSGKSALCAEVSFLCQQLGLDVDWKGAAEENNLGISSHARPKVEIFELVEEPGTVNVERLSQPFDMNTMPRTSLPVIKALAENGPVTRVLAHDEEDPIELWAEIHRLRAAIAGPGRFDTWKDAALAERLQRNESSRKWRETFDAMHQRAMRAEKATAAPPTGDQLRAIIKSVGSFGTNHDDAPTEYVMAGWRAARRSDASEFKEALHAHFDEFPVPTQIGVVAIMKNIEKVYEKFGMVARKPPETVRIEGRFLINTEPEEWEYTQWSEIASELGANILKAKYGDKIQIRELIVKDSK